MLEKHIAAIGISLVLLAACQSAVGASGDGINTTNQTIAAYGTLSKVDNWVVNRQFIEIFRDAQEIGIRVERENYDVSNAVEKYIGTCCRSDQTKIIQLLAANGFKGGNTVQTCKQGAYDEGRESSRKMLSPECMETEQKIAKTKEYKDQEYDDVYVYTRSTGLALYAHKTYRIIMYIKNEKLVRIQANAYIDTL